MRRPLDGYETALRGCVRDSGRQGIDAARLVKPESALATHVGEVAEVRGDRWGGEFVREPLLAQGISYELSELNKSQLYQEFMPVLNSRSVALLDNDRLERQLVALERKVSRGGRDRPSARRARRSGECLCRCCFAGA